MQEIDIVQWNNQMKPYFCRSFIFKITYLMFEIANILKPLGAKLLKCFSNKLLGSL